MTVFLDTSAIYAVLDRDDSNARRAAVQWHDLVESRASLVTSNYVLVETVALAQSRLGMAAVRALSDCVEPMLAIEWVTREDHVAAQAALLAANRRRLSLVDCSSFVVLRRLEIQQVFAFDAHFAEQGFVVLPA